MFKDIIKQNFYKEDLHLFGIFVMVAAAILLKSYYNTNGYLSPDSTNYLKLAQNLLEGKGYYVSAYENTMRDRVFFAVWPIGYPTFIFFTAKLSGLSVFWASKVLSIFCIGIILLVFRNLFKETAFIYGLILLFSAYIEIFSYTWSETLFTTLLLLFCYCIFFLITNPQKTLFWCFSVFISSLLLFLTRYIGAFSFGIIGIIGLYYGMVRKEKLKSVCPTGAALIGVCFTLLYLYHNYQKTGFPTGMERIPAPETNLELFVDLLGAMGAEAIIPLYSMAKRKAGIFLFFLQFFVLTFLVWKYRNNIWEKGPCWDLSRWQPFTLALVFSSTGLVYLFFIVVLRWLKHFDGYSFRLLSPGSFLLFIALIYFLQKRSTKDFFYSIKTFLFVFCALSYTISVPCRIWVSISKHHSPYYDTVETVKKRYQRVEKDSIIVFGSTHISYLYTDMQRPFPYFKPYFREKEKWTDFMLRISSGNKKNIYLSVPEEALDPKRYDETVIDVLSKYDKGTLIKLR